MAEVIQKDLHGIFASDNLLYPTVEENCGYFSLKENQAGYEIDYSSYIPTAGASAVAKKLMIYDNDFDGKCLETTLAFETESNEKGNVEWTFEQFKDGWFSTHFFIVDDYVDTINVPKLKGLIIHYTNSNSNTLYKDSGFYVYTGDTVEGEPILSAIMKEDALWQIPGTKDWNNFIKMIDAKDENDTTWLGHYGVSQLFILCSVFCCLKSLLFKGVCDSCDDPCDPCVLEDYYKVDLRVKAAKEKFCQEDFYHAQKIIQSAMQICSDNNCSTC